MRKRLLAEANSPLRRELNELCKQLRENTIFQILETLITKDNVEEFRLGKTPEELEQQLEKYKKVLNILKELIQLYPGNSKWKSCYKRLLLLTITIKLMT